MNRATSIVWQSSPWWLALGVLAVATAAVLGWLAWRRSGYRRGIALLELLRLAVVALIAVLLSQPEWLESFRPEQRPTVLVLVDESGSMQTRDVSAASEPGGMDDLLTRQAAASPLLDPASWRELEDRFEVILQPFAEEEGVGTDLGRPLIEALEKHPRLRGIVLASDGDHNVGPPPVLAAANLRLREVPVIALPIGSDQRLPDVEVLSFDVPTFAIEGKGVRLPFTIDSSLPRDYVTTVQLTASDGSQVSQEVRVLAMQRTSDQIIWEPAAPGDYTLTLTIPKHPDEILADNNQREAPISIRQERIRVLVVESYPRWEYRYLRNALSRDSGVDVSCLLLHPGLSKVGGGSRDYLSDFPPDIESLSEYDVVFIGDVGLEEGQLTEEQCRLLKGLVEQQAAGIVFMPGWQGRQQTLLETPLADLYPVQLDLGQPGGWGARTSGQIELTEFGRQSLLTRLADTPEENLGVWEGLPGFQWYAPVVRSRPGSDVLAVHGEASNQYGRLPLLVTRTFGSGKVLFMGTDGAWRWRRGVEDLYHYRFWGQVVRWMSYQRNMARGESMRMYYSPEQPAVGQTMSLTANVMQASGEPLKNGQVTLRLTAPSGRVDSVQFRSADGEWGTFTASYTPKEPGEHTWELSSPQAGGSLTSSLFVQGLPLERIGRPVRRDILEELASITRGKVVAWDQRWEALDILQGLPDMPETVRRVQLWSHPLVAGLLVLLLTAFWIWRKVVGLI
jgi:hypothetical protein